MRVENEPPDQFKLLPSDIVSPTWQKLKEFFEQELRTARIKNDDEKLDPIQTAMTRGRIKTLKSLLALENAPPVIPTDGN